MKAKGLEIAFPLNPAPYLTDWLYDIGPVISGGMAMARIEWRDIRAWEESVGIKLEPWEAQLIRRLSGAYLSMSVNAKEEACPAPYIDRRIARRNEAPLADAKRHEADIHARSEAFLKAKRQGDTEAMARILNPPTETEDRGG